MVCTSALTVELRPRGCVSEHGVYVWVNRQFSASQVEHAKEAISVLSSLLNTYDQSGATSSASPPPPASTSG